MLARARRDRGRICNIRRGRQPLGEFLVVFREQSLDALPHGVAGIQRTPHVPQSLLISGVDVGEDSANTLDIAEYVALTGRAVDYLCLESAFCLEIALHEHVHIFSNRLWARVPSTNVTSKGHCN